MFALKVIFLLTEKKIVEEINCFEREREFERVIKMQRIYKHNDTLEKFLPNIHNYARKLNKI